MTRKASGRSQGKVRPDVRLAVHEVSPEGSIPGGPLAWLTLEGNTWQVNSERPELIKQLPAPISTSHPVFSNPLVKVDIVGHSRNVKTVAQKKEVCPRSHSD